LRDYDLEELVNAYVQAVNLDDDILTQFVDGEDIVRRLKKCKSFQDVVETWQWAGEDVDHEEVPEF
jgi:hypothetical protein